MADNGLTEKQKQGCKFTVNDVTLGKKLSPASEDNYKTAWRRLNINPKKGAGQTTHKIEQICPLPKNAITVSFNRQNMLVDACMTAFAKHYPLRLSPDVIWITIMQGFANHVDKNAEKLRSKFVAHEGKKEICVRRDGFVKGSQNNWPNVFPEFCEKISQNLKEPSLASDLETSFSTTSDTDRVVGQIALMDTMKNYFEFKCMTMCGIPSIELLGDKKDWETLRRKADRLKEFEIDFWYPHLTEILDKFVDAFDGKVDTKFWESIAKLHSSGGSGSVTRLTGWLQDLFPYDGEGNSYHLGSWKKEIDNYGKAKNYYRTGGMEYSEVPKSVSMAPFTWNYHGQKFKMTFVGAIGAVVQDPETLALEPVTCWGIVEN